MSDVWRFGVKLFASVREAVGHDSVAIDVPAGANVAALRARLAEVYPPIGERMRALGVAVNQAIVPDAHDLAEGDEVALIPPVGGG